MHIFGKIQDFLTDLQPNFLLLRLSHYLKMPPKIVCLFSVAQKTLKDQTVAKVHSFN